MAAAAVLLSLARAELAEERGSEARRLADEAKSAFSKANDAQGQLEASLVLVSALTLDDKPADALSTIQTLASGAKGASKAQLDILKADALVAQGKGSEAVTAAEAARTQFDALQDARGAGGALIACSSGHLCAGKSKEAVQVAEKAVAAFNKAGDMSGEASAWTSVMTARFAAGDAEGAVSASFAALALYSELGNKIGEATVLTKFAQAQLTRKLPSDALPAATRALSTLRKSGDGKLEVDALEAVVGAFLRLGQASEAVAAAKQSVAAARCARSAAGEARSLQHLARAYAAEQWTEDAKEAATEALKICNEKMQDKAFQASLHEDIARYSSSSTNFDEAKDSAEQALKVYKDLKDAASVTRVEETLSTIQEGARAQPQKDAEAAKKWQAERELELMTLKEAATALVERKEEEFRDKYKKLKESTKLEPEDYAKAFGEMDGPTKLWVSSAEGTGTNVKMYNDIVAYNFFRYAGMHYGPGFRLNHLIGANGINGYKDWTHGVLSCRTAYEGSELDIYGNHWEQLSCYHPGILDCALQVQTAAGLRAQATLGMEVGGGGRGSI